MCIQFRMLGTYFFLSALTCLGSPKADAWKVLNTGLTHGDSTRRAQAISALGLMGTDGEAVKIVENALQDKSSKVRVSAAEALGEMRCPGSIPKLKLALNDKDGDVSIAAAKALAKMGDMSGSGVIEQLLTGQIKTGPGLIHSAMHEAHAEVHDPGALARSGIAGATSAAAIPFVGPPAAAGIWIVENRFKDKGVPGRIVAVNYLIKDPDPHAQKLLEGALEDSNWAVRAAAVKGLGDRGDPGAIPKLEPLLKDGHAPVRFLTAAAILRLSDRDLPARQITAAE